MLGAVSLPLTPLDELAAKYRELAVLRARREEVAALGRAGFDDAESALRRSAFRRLAARFPGALRELDALDARTLAARADAAAHAAAHADTDTPYTPRADAPPWLALALDFHALLTEALAIKSWLAHHAPRSTPLDAAALAAFRAFHAALPTRAFPVPLTDAAALARFRHPPGGRLLALVWAELEQRHARPRAELQALIFGPPESPPESPP